MKNLLLASKHYGFLISTHCQPERRIVARDIELLREAGGNLHVGHISRAETADMIRQAKKDGLTLTCEVTPHHLFGYDDDYRVNPPLRTKSRYTGAGGSPARRHGGLPFNGPRAAQPPEDKAAGMAGISNIEYAVQIFLQVFHDNGIPLTHLSELASFNPARRLGRKVWRAGGGIPGRPRDTGTGRRIRYSPRRHDFKIQQHAIRGPQGARACYTNHCGRRNAL